MKLSDVRRYLGLSSGQYTRLLLYVSEYRDGDGHMLLDYYTKWRSSILSQLGRRQVTTSELARIFGISDFAVHVWIRSGQLQPSRSTGRQHYFSARSVRDLFERNQTAVVAGAALRTRGPLATLFVSHVLRARTRAA